jgi:YD repeat-containing protein
VSSVIGQPPSNDTTAEHFDYDVDGLVSRVILTPPGDLVKGQPWRETKLDTAGRPVEITDNRGLHLLMDYDESGELRGMINEQDGKNQGFKINRDKSGRIQAVNSSWGNQQYAYDPTGELKKMDVAKQGSNASIEFEAGQVKKVKQFDGGEYAIAYYPNGKSKGMPKAITTPNHLVLEYGYDEAGRTADVKMGNESRIKLAYDPKGMLAGWSYSSVK